VGGASRTIAWVAALMTAHGNLGLVLLTALESMGAPIPAEIVLPFAGYLVFAGRLGFMSAVLAASLGGLVGFLGQYAVGRAGGRPLILHYGRYLLITPHHLAQADRWFARYGDRAVLIARLLPVVRGLVSLPAGAAGMPVLPFALWSVAGTLPWTFGLIGAGWALGDLWPLVTSWTHRGGVALGIAAVAAAVLLILLTRRRRRRVQRSSLMPNVSRTAKVLLGAAAASAVLLILGWVLGLPAVHAPAWAVVAAYAASYVAGGTLRLRDGLIALREGRVSIDMLMVLGAAGAAVLGRWNEGAILIFLFALSNALEEFVADRTRDALRALVRLRPETALVRREDGREEAVPIGQLMPGDVVLVRPGESIATDGVVREGTSPVDQASITGESIPVNKAPGDEVFGGTINGTSLLAVEVVRPASESAISRIIRLVEQTQEHKAHTQRMTEWIDRYYTLGVVAVALGVLVIPPLRMGWDWSRSFYLAMQLMVVMSPCALVVATPAALLAAVAAGARRGVLFKGGRHLEQAGGVQVVAIDKTGTLTSGHPQVMDVVPVGGHAADEVLAVAAAVEARSPHPLAQAIVAAAGQRGLAVPVAVGAEERPGFGVVAEIGGLPARVGGLRLLTASSAATLGELASEVARRGQTPVFVEAGGEPLGVVSLADRLRDGAAESVAALKAIGIRRVVMLTGDDARVAAAISARAGTDDFRAALLPEDKVAAVVELRRTFGEVAMVGDGVNDAPALAAADLGVAMGGAGNDASLETADMVLMTDDLRRLPEAFALGRRTRRIVAQNLGFAVAVIAGLVTLTLMAGLQLPFAVVGHEGSTILVALNGLRLLGSGHGAAFRGAARLAAAGTAAGGAAVAGGAAAGTGGGAAGGAAAGGAATAAGTAGGATEDGTASGARVEDGRAAGPAVGAEAAREAAGAAGGPTGAARERVRPVPAAGASPSSARGAAPGIQNSGKRRERTTRPGASA
jgi:Cd2+/Zn2+-exporting ATPase